MGYLSGHTQILQSKQLIVTIPQKVRFTDQSNQANRSYADVVRNDQQQPYAARGYTVIQNDNEGNPAQVDPQLPAENPDQDQQQQPRRHSTRNRCQPDRYGQYIQY